MANNFVTVDRLIIYKKGLMSEQFNFESIQPLTPEGGITEQQSIYL